jgi:hypothetical protein
MGGATTCIGDGSNVDGSTTSIIGIAVWRARNNNLIHEGVDIEMSTYGKVTQSRSVIVKK